MISVKDYESMSYRQLQTAAKNLKVPANFKKCYLIKLLIARKHGDESLVRKIIQSAYDERANIKEVIEQTPDIFQSDKMSMATNENCNSNTELEKLLKVPNSSKVDGNFTNGVIRLDDTASCMSRFCTNSSPANNCTIKRKNAARGRPKKDNLDTNNVESFGSQDCDLEKYYNVKYFDNNECILCSKDESSPSKTKMRKLNDSHAETSMISRVQTPIPDDFNESDEYISVDSWNNYENNSLNDSGIVHNMESNNTTDVTDVFPTENYDRHYGKEKNFSHHHQTQQLTTSPSQIPMFNSQNFFQSHSTDNNLYPKENCIVINQHFKFYGSNLSDQRKIPSPESVTLQNQISNDDDFNQNFTNINNNKKQIDQLKQKITKPTNLLPSLSEAFPSNFFGPQHNTSHNFILPKGTKLKGIREENNNLSIIEKRKSQLIEPEITSDVLLYKTPYHETNLNYDVEKVTKPNTVQACNSHDDQNINIFDDIQNIGVDLRCELNEEISSTLEEYFNNLDIPTNSDMVNNIPSEEQIIISEKEDYQAQSNDWVDRQTRGQWEVPFTPMNGVASSMICFICNWLGKVSNFEKHIRKQHKDYIFKAENGMLSIAIDIGDISNDSNSTQINFIDHGNNLYVIYLKYKYPDIVLPIILSVPPFGQNVDDNHSLSPAKFYLQVNNLVKKYEIIWSGMIEPLNKPGRPNDIDVFSNRKHGRFEISMSSLDLIPNNIPIENVSQYLNGCVVEVHIFIETLAELKL